MSSAAMPPAAATPALNLNTTIGAVLIGGVFSAVFYGITASQTAVYYQRAQADPLIIKLVVGVLWILDTFDMCLISHTLYWYLITNYGNFLALSGPTWSLIMHVLVTSATQTIVRAMFTWRVYKLSQGNLVVTLLIAGVSLIDLTCAIAINVKAFHTTFVGLNRIVAIVYLQFVAGFIGDALAAGYLCYLLHKSRTGVRRTESVINVLTAYTVNSGLLTTMTGGVSVVLFASRPQDFYYIGLHLQLSKLYVNAYLTSLNARDSLRATMTNVVSVNLGSRPFAAAANSCVADGGLGSARTHLSTTDSKVEAGG